MLFAPVQTILPLDWRCNVGLHHHHEGSLDLSGRLYGGGPEDHSSKVLLISLHFQGASAVCTAYLRCERSALQGLSGDPTSNSKPWRREGSPPPADPASPIYQVRFPIPIPIFFPLLDEGSVDEGSVAWPLRLSFSCPGSMHTRSHMHTCHAHVNNYMPCNACAHICQSCPQEQRQRPYEPRAKPLQPPRRSCVPDRPTDWGGDYMYNLTAYKQNHGPNAQCRSQLTKTRGFPL